MVVRHPVTYTATYKVVCIIIHMSNSDLRAWVDFELECLWADLRAAYSRYLEGTWLGKHPTHFMVGGSQWSIECDSLGDRINNATRLIGPLSWRRIGMTGIADGWFIWANQKLGIDGADLPTESDIEDARRRIA